MKTRLCILLALLITALAGMLQMTACGSRETHMSRAQSTAAHGELRLNQAPLESRDLAERPDEELWVIKKAGSGAIANGMNVRAATQPRTQAGLPAPAQNDEPVPTSGTLVVQQENKMIPVPLKHTDVKAAINAYISSVTVTQQFQNPYSEKIEAVYVFPLPDNAGINEFVMTIGDRHIRGIIREREQAEKIYAEARRQGYVASLMTQERPNIFTQKVANIEPGKKIDIQIRYFQTLRYQDGWYEWAFPMVVGPRYNPAGTTDGVGAMPRGSAASGQKTDVHYLAPNERSGHDISLEVDLNAGVTIENLVSVNHQIRRQPRGESHTLVQLDPKDSIPNKDFVLRYQVAGATVKSALIVQSDPQGGKGGGGYFTLMLVPPENLKNLPRRAVEMVFVMDTSGSMSGEPITQAKSAVRVALGKMQPADTFQIVNFASSASQMSPSPLSASQENRHAAAQYVNSLCEGGGTEMLQGINKALDFPHDENRTRVVAFLTDGYIGNELEILRGLHDKLADSRVFSFGVGSSTNRYLLNSMATIGNGAAAYLALKDDPEPVMQSYFERISHPALTNLDVRFQGMNVKDVYPRKIPDLFVGQPVILTGRFDGSPRGSVTVSGKVGNEKLHFDMALAENNTSADAGIRTVWARTKIADLGDEFIRTGRDVTGDIRNTAIEYGLMSQYTAFIAVDSLTRTTGEHGTTVNVPVPMPDGVRYDTTVAPGGDK